MPGPLALYDVTVNGFQTRMRLNEADAARLNAVAVQGDDDAPAAPVPTKVRPAVQNKVRIPVTKTGSPPAGGGC